MSGGTSPSSAEVFELVDDALQGLELEPTESAAILSYANREVPNLLTPDTSYFLLGSYRDPYMNRLRIVEEELDDRLGTNPFLMGDLPELELERLPVFRIRFAVLAAYTDYIVAVYEQDAGGEVTELGKISTTPFFDRSYVLPRDYVWMTDRQIDSRGDATAAAVSIYFNEELSSEEIATKFESIANAAQRNGIEIDSNDLQEHVDERERSSDTAVSYSWVHLNEFRIFELHDRCFPWSSHTELREAVNEIP